MATII